jgi:predicted aspartyl protease
MVRREMGYLNSLVVATYGDFRTTHGVTMAYQTTLSDGHPENDEVWNVVDLKVDVPVIPAELEIPGSRRIPVAFPAGVDHVRLPARVDPYGTVIVRLTVNGRGLDFELDSGAAGIVLNRDVARELGLNVHGRWSNTVAGTFTSGRAVIPKVEIGSIVMNDLVVDALPFAFNNDWSTRVVGLLGFDFIAGCVVKVDYEHGVVEAIRSETFTPPPNGIVLDAILDDEVPMVWMKVNGAIGERFILDTGADDVVFFSGFAGKHPEAVDDHSPKKILSRLFPVVQASGVGGKLSIRPVLIAQMQLGNVNFKDYLAFVMVGDQPAFEGEESDGLIGASTLRNFDLYLDYANSRVVLVPNGRTKKVVPKPAG